jgi:hypothetical protein
MDSSKAIIKKIKSCKKLFNLPKKVNCSEKVFSTIKEELNKYINIMDSIDLENVRDYSQIVEKITQSLDYFIEGKPNLAYRNIYYLINEKLIDYTFYEGLMDNSNWPFLFRARLGDYYNYSKKQMFHIPFSSRHIVKPERFSVTGFPCLYLGSSIYVCWEELNRPDINKFQASRFELASESTLLNLSYTIYDVIWLEKSNWEEQQIINWLLKYLYSWPLQLACSITVDSKDTRYFQAEYVIPQFVMQALIESNIDGVAYISAKGDFSINSPFPLMINYAFPAKDEFGKPTIEFSKKLSRMMKATDPINVGLLDDMKGDASFWANWKTQGIRNGNGVIMNMYNKIILPGVPLTNNTVISYKQTAFSRAEMFLTFLKAEEIIT